MEKLETIDNYYILAFAYRVYDAKWVKEGLILENNPYDVTAQENEEKLSRICFQLMYAMNSYYEKGMINLTAISEYDIYQAAYSYTLDLLEKNQSNLIGSKSALENFASELHKKLQRLKIFSTIQQKKAVASATAFPLWLRELDLNQRPSGYENQQATNSMSEAPRKSNYKPRGEVISNEGKLLTEAGTSPHMERQATQGKLHKSKKKKHGKRKQKTQTADKTTKKKPRGKQRIF